MTKLDPATAEEIATLARRPSFQKLAQLVEEGRQAYFTGLARDLARAGQTPAIDQRKIDYERGLWAGAVYAVKGLPTNAHRDWKRHMRAMEKEEESDSE